MPQKLDGPQRGQVHPGLIWQDAVRVRPSSRERTWPFKVLPTLLSALGAFCLFGRRVFQKCLDNLRSICSVYGYLTQGSANTSDFARGVLAVGNPGFLDISRHFTVHLNSPRMPSPVRGSNGGPRRFTAIVLKVSRRLDDAQVPATRRCFTDGRVRYITDTSPAHWGSGGPDWRGMGPADLEAGQRVSTRWRRKSGEWPERVASGQWSVNLREWSWRRQKSAKTKPIAWGANRWWTVTYGERGRN